ncbi:MAG: hypothetical protein KDC46_00170 [Thermoleophilia bacterium]|nr:hypothetical protein [Thermoleophilia bacterium]
MTRRSLLLRSCTVAVAVAACVLAAAGCGDDSGRDDATSSDAASSSTTTTPDTRAVQPVAERLSAIQDAVNAWRDSSSVAVAKAAAETARNLVVGPDGPDYGDSDGDDTVSGATKTGLLPGMGGEPGIADALAGSCADRDVLGGSWDDPKQRWQDVAERIDDYSASNNRFPELPSHPQRIVGWATLTLRSNDLDTMHEYAGHAQLHVDTARDALTCTVE